MRPARRLSKDSNRSPTMETTPSKAAAGNASHQDQRSTSAWP
ncbi:Uncharacterised protein [Bordetella pertussis]|nr:Uncharacterised protein [Bordetella pertussis]